MKVFIEKMFSKGEYILWINLLMRLWKVPKQDFYS